MPKFTMQEHDPNKYKVLPPDSIVQVEVVEITEREVNGAKGTWTKLEFKFNVIDVPDAMRDEYSEVVGGPIWGSVSARFSEHPDNKLRQWAEALFGIELSVGYELDTDDLIGKRARAAITNYTKRDGGKAHQVDTLFPLTAYASASAPIIQEAPAAPAQSPLSAYRTPQSTQPDPWLAPAGSQYDTDPPF